MFSYVFLSWVVGAEVSFHGSPSTMRYLAARQSTLPKTNIAPENRPSQKESSLPTIHFQVLC